MIPHARRARPDWSEGAEDLGVLVPGLFGVGFLISLFVLAFDAVARLVPAAGRRRQAMLVRDAHGRTNDLAAVRTGSPPSPGTMPCEPRTRGMSALLGGIWGTVALAVVLFGLAIADDVGVDRQAWAISVALVVAVPIAVVSLMWLLAALLGPRGPRWLRSLQTVWPLGAYPRLDPEPQEAGS